MTQQAGMTMHRFLHTTMGDTVIRVLISLLILQPLWEVSQRYAWDPTHLRHLVAQMLRFVSPSPAHATPPVAVAGAEQSVVKTHPLGGQAALDGQASFDADGDVLSYQWYGPFHVVLGPTPSVFIPEGSYTVSLSVGDGTWALALDTTAITVLPCFPITARDKSGKIQLV